jgi:hypothetical protein
VRTCALLGVLAALPVAAQARQETFAPRPTWVLADLFRDARVILLPSVALVPEATETALDGFMTWEPGRSSLPDLLRVGAFARRAARRSWGGASAGAEWTASPGAARLWLGVDATVGAGYGPDAAFVARAGGRLGEVRLEFRSAWWSQSALVRADTLPDSPGLGLTAHPTRHSEAEVSAVHQVGRLSLEGRAGMRFGSLPQQEEWAALAVAVRLTRGTEVFVSGGTRPERPDRGELPGRFLLAGLRITPRSARSTEPSVLPPPGPAPAITVERRDDDEWTLTFRLPAADKVELTGDLVRWATVSLTRVREPMAWRATITAPPGVYHIALRLDNGPWIVPPGLPGVPDGFNGLVGLLELR